MVKIERTVYRWARLSRVRLGIAGGTAMLLAACSSSTEPDNGTVPCSARTPLSTGSTVTGNLVSTDCSISGRFADNYAWTAAANQAVNITMSSTQLDAVLQVSSEDGSVLVAENDDANAGTQNALIKLIPAGGARTVTATSFLTGETGAYTLSVATTSASAQNCEEVFVELGITTQQVLSATDCQLFPPFLDDQFRVYLAANTRVRITMRSTAVDAWLELYSPNDDFLADDDDSGSGGAQPECGELNQAPTACDAQIVFTVPTAGFHTISASTAEIGQAGAYTLTIETAPAGAQPIGQFQRNTSETRSGRKRGAL